MVSNRNLLFQWSIFRGYVSFPEGNFFFPKNSFAQLRCQSQHLGLSPHGAYPYHLDHRGSPALAENCPVDVTTIMNCNCMIMNNYVYKHAYIMYIYILYVNIYITTVRYVHMNITWISYKDIQVYKCSNGIGTWWRLNPISIGCKISSRFQPPRSLGTCCYDY